MELAGEQNASQFIEAALRPHIFGEEYEVKLPLNNGKKKVYLRSPRSTSKFKTEIVEEIGNV